MNMDELPDDYAEIIHSDVRHGHITTVEAYLKHKPECINRLYQFGQSKWTLLLAACYYGHAEIVQLLVTQFKANIEAEGFVLMENVSDTPVIIDGASPIWVAAATNNFRIVQFLVLHGLANVNHWTTNHSTPLRAACYNGNLEMVQFLIQYGANPHQTEPTNYTNLMLVVVRRHMNLVVYFVDRINWDLNQQNESGQTALHIAVKHDCIEITQFLLSRGALNLRDQPYGMTPLMWAASHGLNAFVAAFDGHCSDLEWIEARELLGSAYTGCKSNIEDLNRAAAYLTLAFEARASKNIPKCLSNQPLNVFNNRRECATLEDLNYLVSFGSTEAFYMEGLLIQKRLLGTNCYRYHRSLLRIISIMTTRNQYDVCLRLWFYKLDLHRRHGIVFDQKDLRLFASLFDRMLLQDKAQEFVNDLCRFLAIMKDELSVGKNRDNNDYNLVTLLHLLTISAYLLLDENGGKSDKLSSSDSQVLVKHIRLIAQQKYGPTRSGSSLLHLCCDENTASQESIVVYPCIKTARLLVAFGVDVDAMNWAKCTALHVLVLNSETKITSAIIDLLCDNANAHMDFANSQGNSPIQLHNVVAYATPGRGRQLRRKMNVTPLKCRCARLLKYSRLPYHRYLSSSLLNFVDKH